VNKMENIKSQIKTCDWIMIVGFILMVLTRVFTVGYFSIISNETGADIKEIVTVYEANPLAKWFVNLRHVGLILTNMVIPAFVVALYLKYRNSALKGRLEVSNLQFFAHFIFVLFLLNVLNDATAVIGRIL